ncbi:MAG: hypothetical protein FJX68_11425 [Alphaproteobacteria bacterium]|nr:hypothetical protein [Alphaproteobacteria bacterium]
MKISVDVDCTPQEARQVLGLPDVEPMQRAMMETIRQRMEQALASSDPETLFRTWLPASIQGLEQIQKLFWAAAQGMADSAERSRGR